MWTRVPPAAWMVWRIRRLRYDRDRSVGTTDAKPRLDAASSTQGDVEPRKERKAVMQAASAALVRIVGLGIAIATSYAVVSAGRWGDAADAGIGAGLAGFVGLACLSLGCAFIDGRAGGIKQVMVSWSTVAATVAIGWRVVDADGEIRTLWRTSRRRLSWSRPLENARDSP